MALVYRGEISSKNTDIGLVFLGILPFVILIHTSSFLGWKPKLNLIPMIVILLSVRLRLYKVTVGSRVYIYIYTYTYIYLSLSLSLSPLSLFSIVGPTLFPFQKNNTKHRLIQTILL